MPDAVTPAAEVRTNGYAVVPGVLSRPEIDRIADALAKGLPRRGRAGARHLMCHALVAELACDARLLALGAEILGAEAWPFRGTLFDKTAGANWLVVWHQDRALPLRERREAQGWGAWSRKAGVVYAHAPADVLERVLALRVHLDDSMADNGPLRVLPGTHTLGVLDVDAISALQTTVTPVPCLVERGGVVATRPLLVHASSKVRSAAPRRVLHIEYAVSRSLGDGLELAVV